MTRTSLIGVPRATLDLEQLRRTGLVRLPRVEWIQEFTDYLADCQKYAGHVDDRPRPGIWHNSSIDVMHAPHFFDYARSFTPLVREYFGETANLWSFNAFYTDGNTPYVRSLNGLHTDNDADKVCVLFVFGTDCYIEAAQLLVTDDHNWSAVWGEAGTAWLADTKRLSHCGLLPQNPRTLIWARWASSERK